jgi:hypothetical protein
VGASEVGMGRGEAVLFCRRGVGAESHAIVLYVGGIRGCRGPGVGVL